MNPSPSLLYLILGSAGSGRRQLIADLIDGGLEAADRPAVLLSVAEKSAAIDSSLPRLTRWEWREDDIVAEPTSDATHVFFVTNGAADPIDQIEAFKAWSSARSVTVARVICVVDCQLAAQHKPLFAWFEACIHFSDVVLLNRREGVDNKWLSDFTGHFKKLFYPCLFEPVKDGRVKNPALILVPEARRVSHVFESEPEWVFTDADGDELDEQEESEAGEEQVTAAPEEEPYFARDVAGRRVKRLPDIAAYLRPDATAG